MPLDLPSGRALIPCTPVGPGNKHWVGSNGEWLAMMQEEDRCFLLNVYTHEEVPVASFRSNRILPAAPFIYRYNMARMQLLKIQIVEPPYRFGNTWHFNLIAVFDKVVAMLRGGRDISWTILRNDFLAPSRYVDAIMHNARIYAVTAPRGDVLVWDPTVWSEFSFLSLLPSCASMNSPSGFHTCCSWYLILFS